MFDSFAVFFLRKHFSFDFVSHFSSPAKSHLPFTLITSEREPPQVFMLLEGLYNAFDKIARRLKVFKVETIGDCYVGAYVSHAHYHAYQSVLLSNVINLTFLAHMIAPPFFFNHLLLRTNSRHWFARAAQGPRRCYVPFRKRMSFVHEEYGVCARDQVGTRHLRPSDALWHSLR